MTRITKRMICLFLNLVLIGSLLVNLAPAAKAYIMSADEAINWVASQVNHSIDVDGYPSGQPYQCVDLIVRYYEVLGAPRPSGNGKDYATNALPAGWQRIQGAVPQKGDILVYGASSDNPYGHVAIFESERSHYHQNFAGHAYVERVTYHYTGLTNPYWGVVRPSFTGATTTPLITWTNSLSTPWETNAKVEIRANAPYSGSWGEVGVTVWDANGSVVAQRTENAASDATTYLNIWYNITEETGAVLKPNAYYTYQFHVYFNGTRYESGIGNFTTSPCSNHTVTTISGTPATCTATGLTDGQKCSVCGLVLTEQTVIPAKGHSEVTVKGKAATCTESGLTDGKKCSVCGTVTVAQTVIKAKGHIYTSNMDIDCNVCGAERDQIGEIVYGDINYDGKLNIGDIVIYDKYVTNGIVPEHYGDQDFMLRTDLDRDGAITKYDVEYANQLALGTYTQEDVHGACTGISVTSYPKTTYIVGEQLSTQGLEITIFYGNDIKYEISEDLTVTGFDPTKTGKQTLTVTYHQFTTTYDVTVKTTKTVPMHRMYDPNSGEHFYSGSELERDFLVAAGWHYEGVGFNFPEEGDPVHRLYEPVNGEHLYTMDAAEMNKLLNRGWQYEGVAFNSAETDEVPQYRLHNPNAKRGGYHFTGSELERDILVNAGWEYQGIGWYSCLD